MSPELTQQFEHLSVRIEHMIDRVRELPTDVQTRPVGKSFTPLQAVEHMAVTDQLYANMLQKTNSAKYHGRKAKANFIFGQVLRNLNKPAGSNVPSPPPFLPTQDLTLDQSAAKWRELRAAILEKIRPLDDDAVAIKHVFFGTMSPYDLFLLLEKHQDYHEARLPS